MSDISSYKQHKPQTQASAVTDSNSLYQQIKWARLWLPVAIIGVVIFYQLFVVAPGSERWQLWSQLLFYSIVGPIVTYLTLNWIASEVRERERAQNELEHLYQELQESHALLGEIQQVTEQFASAGDLEATLAVAGQGIAEVTSAKGAAVILVTPSSTLTHYVGLTDLEIRDASERDQSFVLGRSPSPVLSTEGSWVLSAPLLWGGVHAGSVHAYYSDAPSAEQGESFSILSSEFSAAAEAVRGRTRDLMTLVEVDRSMRAEGNLERLLETLLIQMMARAEAKISGVYLADEDNLLHLRAWQGLSQVPQLIPQRLGEGFVGRVAERMEPCIANALSESERQTSTILDAARSAISLPLTTDEGLLGIVVLAHEEEAHFEEASLPFLSFLAGQVSLAVQNAGAYLQSEELAIAEERARIAREIHDGVAQSLAFSALKLDLTQKLMDKDAAQALVELSWAKQTIRESIREVRRSIFALRPIDLERHGFIETLKQYSQDFGEQNGVDIEVQIKDIPDLSTKSEAVLFRIFQEAMHNVAKHAKAQSVEIIVGSDHGCTCLEVIDDGQGFDLSQVSDRVTTAGGLGLKQMRERIEARGGQFIIISTAERGTKVFASLPD